MEFMGNDGHAPSLPILCGFASVSHTVACARTNKSECLSEYEVFRQSESGQAGRFSRIVDNPVDKLWISMSMVNTKATALPLQTKIIVLPEPRDTSKNILKNDIL